MAKLFTRVQFDTPFEVQVSSPSDTGNDNDAWRELDANDDGASDTIMHPHEHTAAIVNWIMSGGILLVAIGFTGLAFVSWLDITLFRADLIFFTLMMVVGGLGIATRAMHLSTNKATIECLNAALTGVTVVVGAFGTILYIVAVSGCMAMEESAVLAISTCIAANPGVHNVYEHCRQTTASAGYGVTSACPQFIMGNTTAFLVMAGLLQFTAMAIMIVRIVHEIKRFIAIKRFHRTHEMASE